MPSAHTSHIGAVVGLFLPVGTIKFGCVVSSERSSDLVLQGCHSVWHSSRVLYVPNLGLHSTLHAKRALLACSGRFTISALREELQNNIYVVGAFSDIPSLVEDILSQLHDKLKLSHAGAL